MKTSETLCAGPESDEAAADDEGAAAAAAPVVEGAVGAAAAALMIDDTAGIKDETEELAGATIDAEMEGAAAASWKT